MGNATPAHARAPVPLSKSLFPELPASSTARQKTSMSGNQSLKKILGDTTPTASAWSNGPVGSAARALEDGEEGSMNANVVGFESGKTKKKGKQKQTLFTLGTFPT